MSIQIPCRLCLTGTTPGHADWKSSVLGGHTADQNSSCQWVWRNDPYEWVAIEMDLIADGFQVEILVAAGNDKGGACYHKIVDAIDKRIDCAETVGQYEQIEYHEVAPGTGWEDSTFEITSVRVWANCTYKAEPAPDGRRWVHRCSVHGYGFYTDGPGLPEPRNCELRKALLRKVRTSIPCQEKKRVSAPPS